MNKDNAGVIAHINVLQDIINRMADNSKSCKQWCILVVSAILTLSTKDADIQSRLFMICLVPLVMFCFLDCYYLYQEKGFRDDMEVFIYRLNNNEDVEKMIFRIGKGSIDRSANIACSVDVLCLRMVGFIGGLIRSFFSLSVLPFYGCLALLLYILDTLI